MAEDVTAQQTNAIELATELTIAWLGNPNVRASAEEVPAFLQKMHETLGQLSNGPEPTGDAAPNHVPAVAPRSSVKQDYIVSLITGQKLKSLASHGLTPAQYRERYGLKPDYPMVVPGYSAQRREVAKKLGLGRKPGQTRAKAAARDVVAPERAAKPVADMALATASAAPARKPAAQRAARPQSASKPAPKAKNDAAPAKRGRPKKADTPAA